MALRLTTTTKILLYPTRESVQAMIAQKLNVPVLQVRVTESYLIEGTNTMAFNYWIEDGHPDPVAGYLEDHVIINIEPQVEWHSNRHKPLETEQLPGTDECYSLKV